MKISTLSIACVTALCVGALAPETAWAKKKRDLRPVCNQFESIQCAASPGTYRHSNYSGKPMSDADMRAFYEGLGMLCNIGGAGMTVASFVGGAIGAAATGPVGWGVGGLCLLQQLVGLGLPPPRPIVVKGKDQNVIINIDMNDPKIQEFFRKNPGMLENLRQQVPKPEKKPKAGEDIPVAKAPETPTTPAAPEVPAAPAKADTPPATAPPKKAPAKPGEMQQAKAVPVTLLNPPKPERK